MKKILLSVFCVWAIFASGYSQQIVSGQVTDDFGNPISDVRVLVKTTDFETSTDEAGNYSLEVPPDKKVLLFEKDQYQSVEHTINGSVINITMAEIDLFNLSLEELMNLEITTASKSKQKTSKAPATIVVVTEEQIETRGYMSLKDVLVDLPDFIVNYSGSISTSVSIRGIEGMRNFQILIDGMRITSPTNEDLPVMENYPVNLAKQIEVVYGPASAIYGADAVSGIINIITKKPTDSNLMVDVIATAGTDNYTNNTIFIGKRFNETTNLTVSAQYFYDENPPLDEMFRNDTLVDLTGLSTGTFKTSWGTMTPKVAVDKEYACPVTAYNIFAKLNISDFSFSVFRNYAQYCSSFGYTPNNAVYNEDVIWGQSVTSVNSSYSKNFENVSLITSLTGSQYQLNPESNYRNIYVNLEPGYKFAFSNLIKAEEQINWKLSEKINFVGGITFENFVSTPKTADLEEKVDDSKAISGVLVGTRSYYKPEGIVDEINTLKYYNTGVYAQAEVSPVENISITAGARFDYSSNYGATFNPRFGIVFTPTARTSVKALFGSAFFAPRPFDSYEHYGSFYTLDSGKTYQSSYWHLPNPELEPIHEKTGELGIKQYIGQNFSISATGYFTKLTNLYAYIGDADYKNYYNGKYLGYDVDYITVLYNQGEQEVYGGNFQLDHSIQYSEGRINSYASVSYVDGSIETKFVDQNNQEKETDAEIGNIIPFIFRIGTDISYKKFTVSPRLISTGKQRMPGFEQAQNPDKRQTIDGYTIVNLSVAYKFGKVLSAFVNVSNLTNQDYRVIGGSNPNDQNPIYFHGFAGFPIRFYGGLKLKL